MLLNYNQYNHLNLYKFILLFEILKYINNYIICFNNCTVLSFEPILEELKLISIP